LESIFLEIRGKLIPFFLNNSYLHKATTLRLDFEDINSMEEADALIGKNIYLPLDTLPELSGNKFYYHEVIGFDVVDSQYGNIGKITGVNDMTPQHFLIIINSDNKEILVPTTDDIITKVDRKNKTIFVNTPDGLIDIYTK